MPYQPIALPQTGETCVICSSNAKTASLFFDRIWSLDPNIPVDVRVWGDTDMEVTMSYAVGLQHLKFADNVGPEGCEENAVRIALMHRLWNDDYRPGGSAISLHDKEAVQAVLRQNTDAVTGHMRSVSEHFYAKHGLTIPTLHTEDRSYKSQYQYGAVPTIVGVLSNLPLVDEGRMEWKQVIDFRSDHESRANFARLVHFFDKEWVGKPTTFIVDDLEAKLDSYKAGIRKHGLATVSGTLKAVLSSKWVAGPSAVAGTTAALGDFHTAVAAAAASIAGVALSIVDELKNLKDFESANKPLAFIKSIQDEFGSK